MEPGAGGRPSQPAEAAEEANVRSGCLSAASQPHAVPPVLSTSRLIHQLRRRARFRVSKSDNYFRYVPKARILAAMQEAGQPPSREAAQLKKADLAARAEQAVQGTGWLPELLRTHAT